ncbi:MAG: hypothetical protein Q9162_001862 [Coniocarpon cinnabarinum]
MINPVPALYVSAITHTEKDKEKQRRLHEQDHIAQWFVLKPQAGDYAPPRLCLTDRYRQLCDPGEATAGWASKVYPGFISFIGDTQMGKSTLVRAMILMGLLDASETSDKAMGHSGLDRDITPTSVDMSCNLASLKQILCAQAAFPVSRSKNIDDMNQPTSHGVHLYKDSTTVWSDQVTTNGKHVQRETPILFADCEGFRASTTRTNAEGSNLSRSGSSASRRSGVMGPLLNDKKETHGRRARSSSGSANRSTGSSEQYLSAQTGPAETSFRSSLSYLSEHTIQAPSYANRGKTGLDVFYARFLYAISDVIVFVVKADGSVFHELQRLMEWALKAVNMAVNRLPHKTLVVVRNCERLHDAELYDPSVLKQKMFTGLPVLWEGSSPLKEYRDGHNANASSFSSKIHTNEDFFSHFFQDIKVSYIPNIYRVEKTDELYAQYKKLRIQLIKASQDSQARRSRIWMQYSVPTLTQILTRAFEHFRVSDSPFDFYMAARNDNPNPTSIAGHIANFLRHTHDFVDFPERMLPQVVAIDLVAYFLRHTDIVTEPEETFEKTLRPWCEEGLDMFLKKDYRCRYRFANGEKCRILKEVHWNAHIDEKGRKCTGSFVGSPEYVMDFTQQVRTLCIEQYTRLYPETLDTLPAPNHPRASKLRRGVLREFAKFWQRFQSNKTCLSCLQACPDHMLQCGHSFCDHCIMEFGSPGERFEHSWHFQECTLCQEKCSDASQVFHLHPPCAGVRVLTLDGGGVRGIVELTLLKALEQYLPIGANMSTFFDLIVGTSTGGIIALGLASLDISIDKMTERFLDLARTTFKETHGHRFALGWDPGISVTTALMIMRVHESVYPTTPLKMSLQELFTSERNLFSAASRPVKAAVTAVKDDGATFCFIANYNRSDSAGSLDFEREEENQYEFKVWEAALATSAAPFWFKPFRKEQTKKTYVDGALRANLPIEFAMDEIKRTYRGQAVLDILLSIGTGIQRKEIRIPSMMKIGGFEKLCISFQNTIDTQRLWTRLRQNFENAPERWSRVRRLNAALEEPYVGLQEHARMQDVYADVLQKARGRELAGELEEAANALLGSLFFFAPDTRSENRSWRDMHYIDGTIRCRIARGSTELEHLLGMFEGFWSRELRDCDMLTNDRSDWARIPTSEYTMQRGRSGDGWFRVAHRIVHLGISGSKVVLGVSFYRNVPERGLGRRKTTPIVLISGFPLTFSELRKKSTLRV